MSTRRPLLAGAVVGVLIASIGVLATDTEDDGEVVAGAPTTVTSTTTPTSTTAATTTTSIVPTTTAPPDTTTPAAPSTTAAPATTPPPPSGLAAIRVRLTPVAGIAEAIDLPVRPGDATLYVADKAGRIWAIEPNGARPVLDIRGDVRNSGEQGLLGAAFSPDGSKLYVHYSDSAGDTRVDEWSFDGSAAVPATRRVVLTVEQPASNHNGGRLTFGPDGLLYLGLGDGGSANDPWGNGQSLGTLLGKILRIDPTPGGGRPYTIPADNPFVGRDGARGEIWSFGLRNPWRFSFDRSTGDLWIGDVGQSAREEVDLATAATGRGRGANFGWDLMEGDRGTPPPDHHAPIHVYRHSGGNRSITGGVVYRGGNIPGLVGAYLFADFYGGRIQGLTQTDGRLVEVRDLGARAAAVASILEGPDGEVYVVSLSDGLLRLDPA